MDTTLPVPTPPSSPGTPCLRRASQPGKPCGPEAAPAAPVLEITYQVSLSTWHFLKDAPGSVPGIQQVRKKCLLSDHMCPLHGQTQGCFTRVWPRSTACPGGTAASRPQTPSWALPPAPFPARNAAHSPWLFDHPLSTCTEILRVTNKSNFKRSPIQNYKYQESKCCFMHALKH